MNKIIIVCDKFLPDVAPANVSWSYLKKELILLNTMWNAENIAVQNVEA